MLDPPSLGPQPERHAIKTRDAYYTHKIKLVPAEGAELNSAAEIIAAADEGLPLVATCDYQSDGYRVELEYPVGTINVSEKSNSYQTDTGPVIYPDFSQPFTRVAETLWLAFCSFNSPDWIEFIIRKPTPLSNGISVNHYSESRWVDNCRNRIFAVS
jgi:hypothetical protein